MAHYLTTGDAARELGIDPATLTRWVAAGIVTPARRTRGGHFRWDMASLRAQLRRRHAGQHHLTAEDIARIIHNANRDLQIVQGDPVPSPLWDDDDVPEYQRRRSIEQVQKVLADPGITPERNHEMWCDEMRADGFVYGEVKDPGAKTHPTLLPWAELPAEQRLKDRLFIAVVRALAPRREETT